MTEGGGELELTSEEMEKTEGTVRPTLLMMLLLLPPLLLMLLLMLLLLSPPPPLLLEEEEGMLPPTRLGTSIMAHTQGKGPAHSHSHPPQCHASPAAGPPAPVALR